MLFATKRMKDKAEIEYLIFDARGNGGGETSPTITGDHQNRITDYTAIIVEVEREDVGNEGSVRPFQKTWV